MKAIEEIKITNWNCISEEDFYEAKRAKILPRMVFFDLDGNIYHYIKNSKITQPKTIIDVGCQRCGKKVKIEKIPVMFCQECVDEMLETRKREVMGK